MQDNQLSSFLNNVTKGKLLKLAKGVITILVIVYVYRTLSLEHYSIASLQDILLQVFILPNVLKLLAIVALVPINWALESYKWLLLAREALPITFKEAFKSTLTGLAIGVAVPAQLGDTVGRIAALSSSQRMKTLGAALVANGVQYYAGLIAGLVGLIGMRSHLPTSFTWYDTAIIGLALLLIIGIAISAYRRRLLDFPTNRKWTQKLASYLEVISHYSTSSILTALGIALLRYMVFVIQYLLTFALFELPLSLFELCAPVMVLLLAKTVIPTLNAVGDLGIRGLIIIWVFQMYAITNEILITITLLIWIINILSPLMVGVYFLWKHQWQFQTKKHADSL